MRLRIAVFHTLLFVQLLALSSCRNEAKDAVAYNDGLIAIQSGPAKCVTILDGAIYGDDLNAMEAGLEKLRIDIVNARTSLENLGPFGEDESFRSAGFELLSAYDLMADDYGRIVKFLAADSLANDSVSIAEIHLIQKRIFDLHSEAHSAFLKAQLAFAVKYKFVLDRNEKSDHQ